MMNSETSSSSGRKRAVQPPASRRAARASAGAGGRPSGTAAPAPATTGFQPLHLLIIGTFGAASAAALVAHGTRPANIVFIVLAVMVSGIVAVALYRTLWPLTSDLGPTQPEMLGGRTRAALERDKTIVLRAIKELEFDRAMGKVSEADCDEMIGRLRARAARLIRHLDAGSAGYRDLIEKEMNARLGARGDALFDGRAPAHMVQGAGGAARGAVEGQGPEMLAAQGTEPAACAVCGVTNDPDAKFCKACGTKLGVPA